VTWIAKWNKAMRWVLLACAALAWAFIVPLASRDWAVILPALLITGCAVLYWQVATAIYCKAAPLPPVDYARITELEMDLYGETFRHDGAPEPPAAPVRSPEHQHGYSAAPGSEREIGLFTEGSAQPAGRVVNLTRWSGISGGSFMSAEYILGDLDARIARTWSVPPPQPGYGTDSRITDLLNSCRRGFISPSDVERLIRELPPS
jgi:hypothetical protein